MGNVSDLIHTEKEKKEQVENKQTDIAGQYVSSGDFTVLVHHMAMLYNIDILHRVLPVFFSLPLNI